VTQCANYFRVTRTLVCVCVDNRRSR